MSLLWFTRLTLSVESLFVVTLNVFLLQLAAANANVVRMSGKLHYQFESEMPLVAIGA